jgi:hypothetical protein
VTIGVLIGAHSDVAARTIAPSDPKGDVDPDATANPMAMASESHGKPIAIAH